MFPKVSTLTSVYMKQKELQPQREECFNVVYFCLEYAVLDGFSAFSQANYVLVFVLKC